MILILIYKCILKFLESAGNRRQNEKKVKKQVGQTGNKQQNDTLVFTHINNYVKHTCLNIQIKKQNLSEQIK